MIGSKKYKVLFSVFIFLLLFDLILNFVLFYAIKDELFDAPSPVYVSEIPIANKTDILKSGLKNHFFHIVKIRFKQPNLTSKKSALTKMVLVKRPFENILNATHKILQLHAKTKNRVVNFIVALLAIDLFILLFGFAVGVVLLERTKKSINILMDSIKLPSYDDPKLRRNALNNLKFLIKQKDDISTLARVFLELLSSLRDHINEISGMMLKKQALKDEFTLARKMQDSLLPKREEILAKSKRFDIYGFTKPRHSIGGDFYDFFYLDENRLCFVIGDVEGHGVHSSIFMTMLKSLINTFSRNILTTGEILTKVNNVLVKNNQLNIFATIFLGILNINTGEVQYTNAGHVWPIFFEKKEQLSFVKEGAQSVLGVVHHFNYQTHSLQLLNDSLLFLYTDGVTEAENHYHQQFTEERLLRYVAHHQQLPLPEMVEESLRTLDGFCSQVEQHDDITALVLRYCPSTDQSG